MDLDLIELLADHYAEFIPRTIYPPILTFWGTNHILIYQMYRSPTLRITLHHDLFIVDYWQANIARGTQPQVIPVFKIEIAHTESINCLDVIVQKFLDNPTQAFTHPLQLVYL